MGKQHSVSFSNEVDQNSRGDDATSHVGSHAASATRCSKSTQSSDTFSLGSLAFSVSTRSSQRTHSTRSSRSSRSSHGSHTTASTHSSNSTQERRRRRELLPVKQERKKRGGRADGSTAGGSSFSGSGGSGKFGGHHHRRRKKSSTGDASTGSGSAGSRNLYNRRKGSGSGSGFNNEEGKHGNLHDHHPVRYPQRSGIYGHIEEGNENDGDDEDETEDDVPVSHVLNASNHSAGDTDEDGLFRRVKKVQDGMVGTSLGSGEDGKNDFLDGLIASTTQTPLKTNADGNTTATNTQSDGTSAGGTSFLSDLLGNRSLAAARQRRGGSVVSSHTGMTGTRGSEASTLTDTTDSSSAINIYKNKKARSLMSDDSTIITMLRRMEVFKRMERYYDEGGEILPKSRKEWAMLVVCALLLSPLVHVMAVYALGDKTGTKSYYGDDIRFNAPRKSQRMDGVMAANSLHSNAWAGSSQVMLSKSSSLKENFVLIPDADWIELQIVRSRAARKSSESSGGSLFGKKSNLESDAPRPPQRMPLPSVVDPGKGITGKRVVLYSLTAANGSNLPDSKQLYTSDQSKLNVNANRNLWSAIQNRLVPRPTDVWPCWSHNSLAQFREDGYTLMYPYDSKKEARLSLIKLAREFGQELIYEFVTWSEDSTPGGNGGTVRGAEERAGSVRRVGKDGSAIVIPPLSNGRSDVMIRRTISTSASASNSASAMKEWEEAQEPAVVMRRVKDLPVEDELTMREWEGPPLEEVRWKK